MKMVGDPGLAPGCS